MRRMSGMDAMFLYNEIPTQHLHTLKLAILDPPEGPEGYSFEKERDLLEETLDRLPPLRWKVVPTPFSINHPLCIEDPAFDLDLHVHRAALPEPGGKKELCDFIAEVSSRPLDRTRPMWEMWMVEGLEGGRIASVVKVHHSLADGHATADMLNEFLTARAGELPPKPARPWQPEPIPSRAWLFWRGVADLIPYLFRGIPVLVRAIQAARKRKAAHIEAGVKQPPSPFTGPNTMVNAILTAQRRFAYTTLPLDVVKQTGRAFGASINDVLLAVVAGGVRRYLLERDDLPDAPLVACVPIDTRAAEKEKTYGNHVSTMYVDLCTTIDDPVERLLAIHEATEASKLELEDTKGARLPDFFEYVPPVISRVLMSRGQTHMKRMGRPSQANVIVSNVRGPAQPLFHDRLPLNEFYSIGPVLEGMGLNITGWSYNERMNIALLADRAMVPDLWPLVDALHDALDELRKAAAEQVASTTLEAPR
ncbi:MAG: wax ester/triacylglycerol synthase family O-acyltransferase [Deltaproteobacteria bacterium]|nr:wax ester/triacylglycerol synthase family O-acyltransferase [Deltaproteobacteria bacterium]